MKRKTKWLLFLTLLFCGGHGVHRWMFPSISHQESRSSYRGIRYHEFRETIKNRNCRRYD